MAELLPEVCMENHSRLKASLLGHSTKGAPRESSTPIGSDCVATKESRLNPQLLEQIFLKLDLRDRLNCARTCRRWADVMGSEKMTQDAVFRFGKADMEKSWEAMISSRRACRNLKFIEVDLKENFSKIKSIGGGLRDLQLVNCWWTDSILYQILTKCTKLESLSISGRLETRSPVEKKSIMSLLLETDPGVSQTSSLGLCRSSSKRVPAELLDEGSHATFLSPPRRDVMYAIEDSLSSVRHLSLKDCRGEAWVKGTTDCFLRLLPNLISISLRNCTPVYKKFLSLNSSSMPLLKDIDFQPDSPRDDDPELIAPFARKYSQRVERLTLNLRGVSEETYAPILSCTKLRHFSLEKGARFGDSDLRELVRNNPDLESLHIADSECLSQKGLSNVTHLDKLRHLILNDCTEVQLGAGMLDRLRKIASFKHFEFSFGASSRHHPRNAGDCALALEISGILEVLELRLGSYGHPFSPWRHLRSVKLCRALESDEPISNGDVGSQTGKHSIDLPLGDGVIEALDFIHFSTLTIRNCGEVTHASLSTLLDRHSSLRTLRLLDFHLEDEVVKMLRDSCPRLEQDLLETFRVSERGETLILTFGPRPI
ncbi:uncharacterized protein LOC100904130 isoform X1 [Galendromus occidentalis]|uniref:Uncharacterized protein LOC100904130 isoform X1 n=1 Tax=Galendromus occidentalis TaxID=34638 RepID=A0AAJ7L5N1_9ACAR|nr:uncharacterized protein LOC100904130 isoform X1 [Galendromus occidentalis]